MSAYTTNNTNTQNELLMQHLMEFYKYNGHLNKMMKIINGDSKISLRIVDWFVTNYSKKRFDPFCRWERITIPYDKDTNMETTIGQLNFFKWAIENNIIEYIENHYQLIENDMNARNSTSNRKSGKNNTSLSESVSSEGTNDENGTIHSNTNNGKTRKKREELSVSACKCIKKETVKIVVKFN